MHSCAGLCQEKTTLARTLYENGFYDIESLKLADRSMLTSEPLSIKLGIALKIVEKISDL